MFIERPQIDDVLGICSHDHFNLLLIAENTEIDIDQLVKKADKQGYSIAGGIFPGLLYNTGRLDHSVLLVRMDKAAKTILQTQISRPEAFEPLEPLGDEYRSAFIWLDGLSAGIPSYLEHIYKHYGNRLNYIGGGCGSLSLKSQPCVFDNSGFYEDAALLIAIPNKITLGVKHGWKKIAGPFLVNQSEGNRLDQINWESAFSIYKQEVDKYNREPLTKDGFFDVAKGFPFGIFREGYEDIVRDPILTEDEKTLTCVGAIESNTFVNVLKGDPDDLIDCAKEAAEDAFVEFVNSSFVVDCISRTLFLDDRYTEELEVVHNKLKTVNSNIGLRGVLSLGEISSHGDGYLEFLNKTIVVAGIS
ncbi:MAG: FIST C-terminal domain-containing protein [Bacteroidota bacterium]